MNHKAELTLHRFLSEATDGERVLSDANIDKIAEDIKEALHRQLGSQNSRKEFRLRMSNIGRPTCQLWFEKNQPEKALPFPKNFIMNMMLGDIVEAVFKGLLRQAGVAYEDSKKVSMELKIDKKIEGTYDIVMDDAVDDIKSASDWSYKNKFESFDTLASEDPFGYVGQLAGYAQATNKRAGGWWVINKANGNFKYVPADGLDLTKEIDKLSSNLDVVESNEFKRCFEPVEETFRGKPTGNKVLTKTCSFCRYKHACWENLQEIPSLVSQAKIPKIVSYIEIGKETTL
tara:strand:- start:3696 stop:4559 length:864 start_codon:yes stop_codon:yes gene_type:complete